VRPSRQQGYESKASAEKGIEAIKTHAPGAALWASFVTSFHGPRVAGATATPRRAPCRIRPNSLLDVVTRLTVEQRMGGVPR
jgi:hypothetical protein